MKTFSERLDEALKKTDITPAELSRRIGVHEGTISNYRKGKYEPKQNRLEEIAKAMHVSISWLMGADVPMRDSMVTVLNNNNVYSIPTYDTVSAGFGALAVDEIVDYTPLYIECHAEAKETICIRVKGDSMFPKIEDGDLIQVRKQSSVDNGSVAVILRDGDEGLVKKVIYGDNWIELHSFNPTYPVMRYENADVQRIRVVGLVKKVIKSL